MRKKRRLIGAVVVVLAGVFAACFSREPDTSAAESELGFTPGSGSGSSTCGSATLGGSIACPAVTITPNAGEHYVLMAHPVSPCAAFVIAPPASNTTFPYTLACLGMGASNGTTALGSSGSQSQNCIPSTYTVNATFNPTSPFAQSCSVPVLLMNVLSGTVDNRMIHFYGYGNPPPVGLQVNPSAYGFGDIPTGTQSSQVSVTVTNTGGQAANVTVTQSNPTNFPSTASNQQLAANGGNMTFNVRCVPGMTTGPLSGTITFNAAGVTSGSASQQLPLTCNGIISNVLIDPSPAAFPSTLVGGQARTLTVTVGASAATTLTGLALGSGHSEDLELVNPLTNGMIGIGGGSNYDVTLRYTPTQAHAQGSLGNLLVTTSPGGTRTVAVTGEALLGKVAATPSVIDFGPVCVNQTATEMFEVYAETQGGFNLVDVVDPASPFDVSSTEFSAPHVLRGNHANAVRFTSSVTPMAPGEIAASAMLKTNLPLNPDLPVELRAVALPEGVSPTPSEVNFGPNPILTPTIARKVVVSNCGAAPINISAVRITGTNASEFAIVSPQDPLVAVPQMGELEFLVVMSPQTSGAKIAQLEIDHDGGGMAVAALEGTAFGGDMGTDTEMGTYYTCSVGAGTGLIPLGVAFLLVRRRRRNRA